MSGSTAYPTGPTCHQPVMFSGFGHATFDNISSWTCTMDSELIQDSVRYSNNFKPINNTMVKKMVTQTVQMLHNPSTAYGQISAAINTNIGTNAQVTISDDAGNLILYINQYLINKTMADPNTGV